MSEVPFFEYCTSVSGSHFTERNYWGQKKKCQKNVYQVVVVANTSVSLESGTLRRTMTSHVFSVVVVGVNVGAIRWSGFFVGVSFLHK